MGVSLPPVAVGVLSPSGTRRRLQALALDLPVVVGWAVLAGGVGMVLRWLNALPDTPAGRDALAFGLLVLPTMLTFALFEASTRQATPGKRRAGLRVVDSNGRRLAPWRSLLRSAVKFGPWQMAHSAVFHLAADATDGGYLVLSIAAQALVLASFTTMIIDRRRRAFHDLLAGSRVVDR